MLSCSSSFFGVPVTVIGTISLALPAAQAQDQSLVTFLHVLSATLLPVLLVVSVVYWNKNAAKHRRLLRMQRSLSVFSEAMRDVSSSTRSDAERAAIVKSAIHTLLDHLLRLTERQRRLQQWFYPGKPSRTAWVFVPDDTLTVFKTAYSYPELPAYERVRQNHQPALWNRTKLELIDSELADLQAQENPRNAERIVVLRKKRLGHVSLTGYVFDQNRAKLMPDLDFAETDRRYIDMIPEEVQESHRFRSAAGMTIRLGEKKLGVLMLFDTLNAGFLGADVAPLLVYADLLAPLLDSTMPKGRGEAMPTVS